MDVPDSSFLNTAGTTYCVRQFNNVSSNFQVSTHQLQGLSVTVLLVQIKLNKPYHFL